ncbi:hypothetical protein [Parapedobacter koreensis]|uniref:Uncharacterized protein n=1 Tax=Parapedobacter koreensis TaxID=332977 RepID=A0A1H7SVN4_9SPHI|nr:hypothetical protein [Parapedobacter koreensis]SEL76425.1 hypothetical protein SAMN05421740_109222 [Parapedobacter koreensis]
MTIYWERLTDGLLFHETAMLAFGALSLLTLFFLVVFFALGKRPSRPLLFSFILPLTLLGWPSIVKIQLTRERVALECELKAVQKNPNDEQGKQRLQEYLNRLEHRNMEDPEILVDLAWGKYMLEKDEEALNILDKLSKDNAGANEIRAAILKVQDIQRKLGQAEKTPNQQNLEILEISKNQLLSRDKVTENSRIQKYISKSDSLIKKANL